MFDRFESVKYLFYELDRMIFDVLAINMCFFKVIQSIIIIIFFFRSSKYIFIYLGRCLVPVFFANGIKITNAYVVFVANVRKDFNAGSQNYRSKRRKKMYSMRLLWASANERIKKQNSWSAEGPSKRDERDSPVLPPQTSKYTQYVLLLC